MYEEELEKGWWRTTIKTRAPRQSNTRYTRKVTHLLKKEHCDPILTNQNLMLTLITQTNNIIS